MGWGLWQDKPCLWNPEANNIGILTRICIRGLQKKPPGTEPGLTDTDMVHFWQFMVEVGDG